MKMIRHHAIRQYPAAGEILIHPHIHSERFAFPLLKHKPPIHHPRYAVVNHRLRARILPTRQPSGFTHVTTLPPETAQSKRFSTFYLSPCTVLHSPKCVHGLRCISTSVLRSADMTIAVGWRVSSFAGFRAAPKDQGARGFIFMPSSHQQTFPQIAAD